MRALSPAESLLSNDAVAVDGEEGPLQVQVIHLPGEAALEAFLVDPGRVALAETHRAVVGRTDVIRVSTVV